MKVVVIGGGPAGLIAAATAKADEVILIERNEKTGKKLYITGKGRCNLTNDVSPREFVEKVVSNPKFLLGAINSFTPSDTVSLIESLGVKTKTERGGRVFPLSDKSSDIIKALTQYAGQGGAKIMTNTLVINAYKNNKGFVLETSGGKIECDALIIATGGVSYPATGSDGSGYKLAKAFGHIIVPPVQALVPINLSSDVSALAGISLKNVTASVSGTGFTKSEFGEMLFTHTGVSGPIILTLSSLINRFNLKGAKFLIDLKPALTAEKLDARILSDFEKYKNKQFKNALGDLLPSGLIDYMIAYTGIPRDTEVNSITKAQRNILVSALKGLTFDIDGLERIEAAVVTAGGVDVSQVNPKTMESKLVKNLFFAGEILDIDAFTGGYNIQIALSTGYLAGLNSGAESI